MTKNTKTKYRNTLYKRGIPKKDRYIEDTLAITVDPTPDMENCLFRDNSSSVTRALPFTTSSSISSMDASSVSDEAVAAALKHVAPSLYTYHMTYEDAVSNGTKDKQVFMAYNGVMERSVNTFDGNTLILVRNTDSVPGLDIIKDHIESYSISTKIPSSILLEIYSGFRAVYERDSTESAAQIYRNKTTGDYFVYYPEQQNTGTLTTYKDDIKAAQTLRSEHTLVMELHSHCNFGAFWSGTDDANERDCCLYVVIGMVATPNPIYCARIKYLDQSAPLKLQEVFDIPEESYNASGSSSRSEFLAQAIANKTLPLPPAELLRNAKPRVYTSSFGSPSLSELRRELRGPSATIPRGMHNYRSEQLMEDYYKHRLGSHTRADCYDIDYDFNVHTYGSSRNAPKSTASLDTSAIDIDWLVSNITAEDAILLFMEFIRTSDDAAKVLRELGPYADRLPKNAVVNNEKHLNHTPPVARPPKRPILDVDPQSSLLDVDPQSSLLDVDPQSSLLDVDPQRSLLDVDPQSSLLDVDLDVTNTEVCRESEPISTKRVSTLFSNVAKYIGGGR